MTAPWRARLESFLRRWVEEGEVTAAVAASLGPRGELRTGAWPREAGGALFDAASLTKPFVATLALRLEAAGELSLETPVKDVWPECRGHLAERRLEDLLRHRSGLAAWTPLYRRCRGRRGVERLLASGRLEGAAIPLYSDLGYIAWGIVAERALGVGLERLLRERVLSPLGLQSVTARPGSRALRCDCDNGREVELAAGQGIRVRHRPPPARGVVQDGNARFLGGLAGHAGLFLDADAAIGLGRAWLDAWLGRPGPLDPALVRRALRGRGGLATGWARRRVRGAAGAALSPSSFGHVGFTGTSLWIDPEAGRVHVLLAHRRDPFGNLNRKRREFHALVAA